jgi:hypothetical protein
MMSHQVSFLVVPLVLDGEGLVVPQVVTAGIGTPWGLGVGGGAKMAE